MNPLLLCALSLFLLAVQESSNPRVPSSGVAAKESQNGSDQEEDERNGVESPEESVRDSALPTQIRSDSVPVQKESEGTEPNKHSPNKDDEIPWKDWAVVAFTAMLALVACFQFWLYRLNFYAVHRPRLRVRRLVVIKENPGPNVLSHYLKDGFSVSYSVTNIGGTEAADIQESIGLYLVKRIGVGSIGWKWDSDVFRGTKIPVGEPFNGSPLKKLKIQDWQFDRLMNRKLFVYIIGGIRYKDGNGVPYETAFCRRFNPATDRFERVENPDYEYED